LPTPTYTALATTTVSSAISSITLSSIPATYRDLILVSMASSNDAFRQYRIRLNGDTGANYNEVAMYGTGSTTSSQAGTSSEITIYNSGSGGNFSVITTQFMDYAVTDKHKSLLTRASSPAQTIGALANRWANTAAITSIQVFTPVGTFDTGMTVSLYGIEA
jgi:hypothetical protein